MTAQLWNPFESLTERQRQQVVQYEALLVEMNGRINLVSRDTEPHAHERHSLHALTLALRSFPAGSTVTDWGTGGGLPAIPLAVAFPDVRFAAVDATEKKVRAVRAMARRLGIANLDVWNGRAEAYPGACTHSVSRATAPLTTLWTWHQRVAVPAAAMPGGWPPGLICLKGGDLEEEIAALRASYPNVDVEQIDLYELLGRPYFQDKYILAVQSRETAARSASVL